MKPNRVLCSPPPDRAKRDEFAWVADQVAGPPRKIVTTLNTQTLSFDYKSTPLIEVLNFIRDLYEVNMVIAPELKDAPKLTLKIDNMQAHSALQWIVRLCDAKMEIKDGAIYVGPADTALAKKRYRHSPIGRMQIDLGGAGKFEFNVYEGQVSPELRKKLLEALQKALTDADKGAAPPKTPPPPKK